MDKSWLHADLGVEVEISCVVYAQPAAQVSRRWLMERAARSPARLGMWFKDTKGQKRYISPHSLDLVVFTSSPLTFLDGPARGLREGRRGEGEELFLISSILLDVTMAKQVGWASHETNHESPCRLVT